MLVWQVTRTLPSMSNSNGKTSHVSCETVPTRSHRHIPAQDDDDDAEEPKAPSPAICGVAYTMGRSGTFPGLIMGLKGAMQQLITKEQLFVQTSSETTACRIEEGLTEH